MEVADGIKDGPSLPLLSCESPMPAKENPDRETMFISSEFQFNN